MSKLRLWYHFGGDCDGFFKVSWADTKLVWNELHNPAYVHRMTREPIGNVMVRIA